MSVRPEISVVIPTYEESETIGLLIHWLDSHARERAMEILVIDDSPNTKTCQEARKVGREVDAFVIAHHRTDKSGLGSAVIDGFRRAQGDALVVMDGDGQHPATVVPELVDALDHADVAIGSRHEGNGSISADWSLRRVAMSFGASAIAWAAVPDARRIQDPMSGFFAVRADVVAPLLEELEPNGHKILLEILVRCPVDSLAEVPFEFGKRDAGESTTDVREMGRFVQHMGQLAIASRRRKRPTRVTPVGREGGEA